jgi:protoheme IX farnesyltransferase
VLFAGHFAVGMLLPMAGVFLLACGSAALNQVQERRYDAKMARTKDRPIPSGRIAADWALFLACALIGAGLYLLSSIESHTLAILGLGAFSVLWYNGVYVFLKRVTAFAVVPGSLLGAIPPIIGWSAAGGLPQDAAILEVAFFFFLWQIPHFWLLLQKYGKQYEEAGLRSPTALIDAMQFRRITFAWVAAVAATGLVLAVMQRFGLPWNLLALMATLHLVFAAVGAIRKKDTAKSAMGLFLQINLYAVAMMVLLSVNALSAA